jgi:membrane fusion protein (multidrug efflux system)
MSPTSTEQNDLKRPETAPPDHDLNHGNDRTIEVEDRRSFFRKNPLAKPIAILALIAVVVAVGWYWWDSRRWESTDDAEIDGHIYPISARVGGQVIKVNYDDGQFVHKGDVLVVIDPTDYKVAVDRAQADYQDAQAAAQAAQYGVPVSSVGSSTQIRSSSADMANALAGVAAAQKQVEAAQAQVVEAQATAQKLNADVLRYRQLLDKREISQQQFDQATSSATAANATVTAREAALLAARAQVQQAESRVEQARAEVQNAQVTPKQVAATEAHAKSADAQVLRYKSALDQAQLNLGYTTILAPVDGIVGKRSVQVGQNVSPGQDLMAVVPLREIWVTANFKETQLAHMLPGQPVKVKVDTYGGRKWDAHVSSIGAATGAKYSLLPPENATGNYVKVVQRIPVRIDFDNNDKPAFNQDGLLRPGMSVTPDVKVSVQPEGNNSKK